MERLTRPNLNVDKDTDRFLHAAIGGKEIDWKQCRDSTLNVLINGPTSNGFGKDIFRKMARDLYGRLKAYEDTGLPPTLRRWCMGNGTIPVGIYSRAETRRLGAQSAAVR